MDITSLNQVIDPYAIPVFLAFLGLAWLLFSDW